MSPRYFLILLIVMGFIAPVASFAQDAEKAVEKAPEPAIEAEAPKIDPPEAPKVEPPEAREVEVPQIAKPIAPTPPPPPPMPSAVAPMKMESPKPPEMPKMEPPKIDPELAASTERWVNLSDQQRLDILEEWKKLPEENRIPFMLYRDEATKKVKPEAKVEATDAKDAKDDQVEAAPAPDTSVPAADAPAEGEGTVSKLIENIF